MAINHHKLINNRTALNTSRWSKTI